MLFAIFIPFLELAAQEGPGVQFKSVDWMMNQPSGNFETDQTKSGEDWWYSMTKMYDASDNHIGYIGVGYSNFVNEGYYENIGCVDAYPTVAKPDFHVNGIVMPDESIENHLQGATYQTIGLFDLAGKMYRCRTLNVGVFWDVIQSEDRQSIIAVGESNATEDITAPEWNDADPNGFVIYNPDGSPTNTTWAECENYGANLKKVSVVKMDMSLKTIFNYQYGSSLTSSLTLSQQYEKILGIGYAVTTRIINGTEKYIVGGMCFSSPANNFDNAYILSLDKDGFKIDDDHPLALNYASTALDIINGPNNEYYLSGNQRLVVGEDEQDTPAIPFVACYLTSSGGNLGKTWDKVYDNSFHSSINESAFNGTYSLAIDHNNRLLMAVVTSCTKYNNPSFSYNPLAGHEAKGTGMIYTLTTGTSSSGGAMTSANPVSIGTIKAYDLKIGITSTSDMGFAVISTKTPKNNGSNYWDGLGFHDSFPNVDLPPGITDWEFGVNDYFMHNYDADAYIAKYTAVSGQWVKKWDKEIDTDEPRKPFPGQIKKQECVYKIEEAEDGGLVFAGNTSHNHDDSYLVKVHSDCNLDEYNDNAFDEPTFQDSEKWIEVANGNGTDYYLSQSETWDGVSKSIAGRILVQNGKTLIIRNSTIKFADGGSIGIPTEVIVLKGGILVVENSTLTVEDEYCPNSMWSGIQVRGNPNTMNEYSQGKVIVSNSTIEHARMAILAGGEFTNTGKYGFQGGGIVRVLNGSIFQHNRFDIKFYPYHASYRKPHLNTSYIQNSYFKAEGILNDPAYIYTTHATNGVSYPWGTSQQIQLWNTHGMEISGNTFTGNSTIEPFLWATGIVSYDATYKVIDNSFDKNFRAIDDSYSSSIFAASVLIENNQFTGFSETAVYLKNTKAAQVEGNTFNFDHNTPAAIVPDNIGEGSHLEFLGGPSVDPMLTRGLYLHNSQDYWVTKNNFQNSSSGYRGNGLTVYNTDWVRDLLNENYIYDNQFNNLVYSSFGNGENNGDGDPESGKGLDFKCNEYANNAYDILTTSGPGISPAQGFDNNVTAPAGNTFDGCGLQNAELFNNGEPLNQGLHYTYYHHASAPSGITVKPDVGCYKDGGNSTEVSLQDYSAIAFTKEAACPDRFGRSSGRVAEGESGYDDAKAAYLTNLGTFNSTIDGGNTQTLLDAIANDDTPAQIATAFDPVAPYLSDEVLIDLISNKPTRMPDADLVAILVDNSPLTQAVLDEVAALSPALKSGDQATLDAAQSGTSARWTLEMELAYYQAEMDMWRGEWTRALIHDYTVVDRPAEIRRSMADEDNLQTQALRVGTYVMENDLSRAQDEITNLRADVYLARDLADLMDLQLQWMVDSTNEDTIIKNPAIRATLKALADNESSVASFGAKNMLAFADNQLLELHDYFEPVRVLEVDYFPQDGVTAKKDESETTFEKSIDQIAFTAYPNPTSGVINFDTKGKAGMIFIYDLRGQLLKTMNVKKDQIEVIYNMNYLASGLYLASFRNNSNEVKSIRIVKQ